MLLRFATHPYLKISKGLIFPLHIPFREFSDISNSLSAAVGVYYLLIQGITQSGTIQPSESVYVKSLNLLTSNYFTTILEGYQ